MNRKPQQPENLMSQPEVLDSFAGIVDRAGIRSTKTGRASEAPCRKSLIINDQISHPHPNRPEMSGSGLPTPDLSGVIRAFALKTRTATPAVTALQHRCQTAQTVAPCCSVLQRVAPCFAQKSFQTSGATPPRSILPTVGPVSRPAGPETFLPRSTATLRQTSRTWA